MKLYNKVVERKGKKSNIASISLLIPGDGGNSVYSAAAAAAGFHPAQQSRSIVRLFPGPCYYLTRLDSDWVIAGRFVHITLSFWCKRAFAKSALRQPNNNRVSNENPSGASFYMHERGSKLRHWQRSGSRQNFGRRRRWRRDRQNFLIIKPKGRRGRLCDARHSGSSLTPRSSRTDGI